MALAYLILSLLALIGLSGLLFYRAGQSTIYRRVALSNNYSVPSVLQNLGSQNQPAFEVIFHNTSTRTPRQGSEISARISEESELGYNSNQHTSIVYKSVTRRMTIVKNNVS